MAGCLQSPIWACEVEMITGEDMIGAIVWRGQKALTAGAEIKLFGLKYRHLAAGDSFVDDAGQEMQAIEAGIFVAMKALVCELDKGVAEGYMHVGTVKQWGELMNKKLRGLDADSLSEIFFDLGQQLSRHQAASVDVAAFMNVDVGQ